MKRNISLPVSTLLLRRANLMEIIISVIIIGFGISLTVSSMTLFENFNAQIGFFIGLATCAISLLYIVLRLIIRKKDNYIYNGFFMLQLVHKVQKLTGLPVRGLPNIMTISL